MDWTVHLEFPVGTEIWVLVVESNDEPEGDKTICHVVDPSTAVGLIAKGPTDGMDDLARLMFTGIDAPDFLETKSIRLGVTAVAQIEASDDFFGERAVCAFREKSDTSTELHAGLKGVLHATLTIETDLIGADTKDARETRSVDETSACKARIDLDAQFVSDGAEPGGELGERGDVCAKFGHLWRLGDGE